MTGPEGGFYSHNTFNVDHVPEKPSRPEQSPAPESSPFAELTSEQMHDIHVGPLNGLGLRDGMNDPAFKLVGGETVADMLVYAQGLKSSSPDAMKARADLSRKIQSEIKKAIDKYWDSPDAV